MKLTGQITTGDLPGEAKKSREKKRSARIFYATAGMILSLALAVLIVALHMGLLR